MLLVENATCSYGDSCQCQLSACYIPLSALYKDSKREFRQRLRQAPRLHEQEEFSRIEQLSELDQKGFWKVISSRKPKKRSSGRELVFGGSKLAH